MNNFTCYNCKIYVKEINKLRINNTKLHNEILELQNIIKLLNTELEEIKINNYDPIDDYFV